MKTHIDASPDGALFYDAQREWSRLNEQRAKRVGMSEASWDERSELG